MHCIDRFSFVPLSSSRCLYRLIESQILLFFNEKISDSIPTFFLEHGDLAPVERASHDLSPAKNLEESAKPHSSGTMLVLGHPGRNSSSSLGIFVSCLCITCCSASMSIYILISISMYVLLCCACHIQCLPICP